MRMESGAAQFCSQLVKVVHQGFTSRDHDDCGIAIMSANFTCHLFLRFLNNLMNRKQRMYRCIPTVFHVAPNTTYVATAKADEISGLSLVKPFTLKRIKRFHHWNGS